MGDGWLGARNVFIDFINDAPRSGGGCRGGGGCDGEGELDDADGLEERGKSGRRGERVGGETQDYCDGPGGQDWQLAECRIFLTARVAGNLSQRLAAEVFTQID